MSLSLASGCVYPFFKKKTPAAVKFYGEERLYTHSFLAGEMEGFFGLCGRVRVWRARRAIGNLEIITGSPFLSLFPKLKGRHDITIVS